MEAKLAGEPRPRELGNVCAVALVVVPEENEGGREAHSEDLRGFETELHSLKKKEDTTLKPVALHFMKELKTGEPTDANHRQLFWSIC